MVYTAKILMKNVVAVAARDMVSKAAQVMKKANIGSVLVGDKEKPDGIFTERDVTRRVVAEGLDPYKTPIGEVMTKKIVTIEYTETLEKVFECLSAGKFRHLPITDHGRVVGIVSLTDLANVLREMYRDEKFLQTFADEIGTRGS